MKKYLLILLFLLASFNIANSQFTFTKVLEVANETGEDAYMPSINCVDDTCVVFHTADRGYANVYKSYDNGKTWFKSFNFDYESGGWRIHNGVQLKMNSGAYGENGKVIIFNQQNRYQLSYDGGYTFKTFRLPKIGVFPSEHTRYGELYGDTIIYYDAFGFYRSFDFGENWELSYQSLNISPITYYSRNSDTLNFLFYSFKEDYWIEGASRPPLIKATSYNGGESWEEENMASQFPNIGLSQKFILGEKIWLTGSQLSFGEKKSSPILLYSSDFGNNWEFANLPEIEDTTMFTKISFYDALLGMAVGKNKMVITKDGGETWENFDIKLNLANYNIIDINWNRLGEPIIVIENEGVYLGRDISSVEESESPKQEVFPNPSHDLLNIDYNGSYSIYDLSGTKVSFGTSSGRIDISGLTPGVYFLETSNQERHKFVRQ